ncbi:hypothetical protein KDL29_11895 [bacterium]|nr:hypothetical protein [bacterium]
MPSGLPADGVQPWEQLDAGGHVQPEPDRVSSSINGNTDFTAGIQRFLESGDVLANGEASRLNGTDDSGTSYAMYRVSLGAQQPGIVSVDANLLGNDSEYYVGISDYGNARWDWHGPFSDNHVRIEAQPEAGSDLTSTFGNAFITVLVNTGSSVDVVGLGVNQYDIADAQAPGTPAGLTLSPVSGGVELEWSPVLEADLAGYAVYYASRSFISVHSAGVQRLTYLEGNSRHLLSGLSERTWIAISSVDFSGNESAATAVLDASPLVGDAPALLLTGSAPGGSINDVIQLTASGADSFDWDLNGDGVFEVEDDATGSQFADTSATGIIRPRVRASDASGEAVALGGLSLLVSGNSAPYTSVVADPQSGNTPLDVTFAGTAEDAEDGTALAYAWDFDGDGIFEPDTDTAAPEPFTYLSPGLFNARFRAQDSQGAWSVASVGIMPAGEDWGVPLALLSAIPNSVNIGETVRLDASDSHAAFGESITQYVWDLDNDDFFETNGDLNPIMQIVPDKAGEHTVQVRISESGGQQVVGSIAITVHGWSEAVTLMSGQLATFDIEMIKTLDGIPCAHLIINDGAKKHFIATAQDDRGEQWNEPLLVSETLGSGIEQGFSLVNGNPALSAYISQTGSLAYMRAVDPAGQTWPGHLIVNDVGDVGLVSSLAVIKGKPAIAYFLDDDFDLYYIRADDANGSTWGTPVLVDDAGDVGSSLSIAVVNGRPAIAYEDFGNKHLLYVRATEGSGAAWGSPLIIEDVGSDISSLNLHVVNSYPVLAYEAGALNATYVRALDMDGEEWGDKYRFESGDLTDMGIVDGKPAVICFDQPVGQLKYIHAIDEYGDFWSSPEIIDVSGNRARLVDADGMPGILVENFVDKLIVYMRKY